MNPNATPDAPAQAPARLQLSGITKRYPAVVANCGVSLTVQPGEIHAVLGENGAGKSTLMKIIYGTVKPDEGSVQFDGRPVSIRNPQEARQLGIAMVFQHFSLFDTLTVAENVWLGQDRRLPLAEVARRVRAAGWEPGNVDASVVTDHPKLAPARTRMQEKLSAAVGAPVTVKGRRPEGLGALGRGEGAACWAVAVVTRA